MNTTHNTRIRTGLAVGALGLATVVAVVPSPAQANRIPADPVVTFVATPPTVARLVASAQGANMRAELQDRHSSETAVPSSATPTAKLAAAAHGTSVRAALQDLR